MTGTVQNSLGFNTGNICQVGILAQLTCHHSQQFSKEQETDHWSLNNSVRLDSGCIQLFGKDLKPSTPCNA